MQCGPRNQTNSKPNHCHFARAVYLHEGNKKEEGVGSPPDLLVQETGQKGEHPILGGTTAEDRWRDKYTLLRQMNRKFLIFFNHHRLKSST